MWIKNFAKIILTALLPILVAGDSIRGSKKIRADVVSTSDGVDSSFDTGTLEVLGGLTSELVVPMPPTDTRSRSRHGGVGESVTQIAEQRIVNGEDVAKNSLLGFTAPILSTRYMSGCGGFIFKQGQGRWIITASHCVDGRLDDFVNGISFGGAFCPFCAIDNYNGGSKYNHKEIEKCIVHPNYDSTHGAHYPNDIALCKLKSAHPQEYYQVPLADKEHKLTHDKTELTAYGLGKLSEAGVHAETVQKVTMEYKDNRQCTKDYGYTMTDDKICAGGHDKKDTCNGDSGGPLIDYSSGKPVVVGLTSYGPKVCGSDTPGVYVNVAYQRIWIDDILCKEDNGLEMCQPSIPTSAHGASGSTTTKNKNGNGRKKGKTKRAKSG
mmetsp:Transcript_2676/g.3652  ORF Transcript_2676/g.3652 Transcript_2676/m.3652 type:complete len:380 (+) Transcript_2676:103-1242(+)